MTFDFATVPQVVFGPGRLAEAGTLVASWGRHALVVTGASSERSGPLRDRLADAGIATETFPVSGEPTIDTAVAACQAAHAYGADFIVGFGGGSALDTAKAAAGLMTNSGDPLDYVEVVGRGRRLVRAAAPWMAVPTTAGTGSEATRNAVLGVPSKGVKVSLRSPFLLARIALVDPALALDLPDSVTAATGMDALTQLIEAYVCTRANPMTDALCAQGISRAAAALPRLLLAPRDIGARSDMALASLWSGIALANAGLGAVHGFAAPIGGRFKAPHGAVCAILLGPVMEANVAALRRRSDSERGLLRYREIARWLTGDAAAEADDGIRWVRELTAKASIPKLGSYGIGRSDIAELVERTRAASSYKANPAELGADELAGALGSAL